MRLTASEVGGMIYAIGGHYDQPGYGWLNTVERLNPNTDGWRTELPMLTRRGNTSSATVGDVIYVFGGLNYLGSDLDITEAFYPFVVRSEVFLPIVQ